MIRIHEDLEALSRTAADYFVELAGTSIRRRGRFDVALAGGHTPRRTYELLAEPSRRDTVDWKRVHLFWGDERCVPPEDERSNARMAREAFIDHVPVPKSNVHPVACAGGSDAGKAAAAYERLLRAHFGEDTPPQWSLVFLGLGADGHTASLLPDSPLLLEDARWVGVADPPDEGGVIRVTLTPPAMRSASELIFLVAGPRKAGALHTAHSAPFDPQRLPAHAVRPIAGKVTWLVDTAAGDGLLQGRKGSA